MIKMIDCGPTQPCLNVKNGAVLVDDRPNLIVRYRAWISFGSRRKCECIGNDIRIDTNTDRVKFREHGKRENLLRLICGRWRLSSPTVRPVARASLSHR